MAAFPRTVPPASVTYPHVIGSLISVGQSGALQTRSEAAQGRIWTETWAALPAGNEDVQELLTTIENLFNTGDTCTLTHYLLPGSGKAAHGAGGGTPLVKAAGQSGTTLDTDGWTNSTGVLKAGDCFTIAGLTVLFRATADVTSHASGGTTEIPILPPIVAGSSPADNAALTIASANLTAVIQEYSAASAGPDQFIGGLQVTFREAP
jgi:hypothetical protein